jgi:hypothetical protein
MMMNIELAADKHFILKNFENADPFVRTRWNLSKYTSAMWLENGFMRLTKCKPDNDNVGLKYLKPEMYEALLEKRCEIAMTTMLFPDQPKSTKIYLDHNKKTIELTVCEKDCSYYGLYYEDDSDGFLEVKLDQNEYDMFIWMLIQWKAYRQVIKERPNRDYNNRRQRLVNTLMIALRPSNNLLTMVRNSVLRWEHIPLWGLPSSYQKESNMETSDIG